MKKFSFTSAVLSLALGLGLGLSAPATAAPVQWTVANGGNDNWYEVVWPRQGKITASTAKALAEASTYLGVSGYLATITSAAEQTFLNTLNAAYTAASNAHSGRYVRAWLGGSDATIEGTWEWTTGETFAYTNWANNANNNNNNADKKDYLAGWWRGDRWRDCKRNCNVYKYVVEYDASASISPVPVPASLPMIAAGLGLMAFVARRRKKA